MQSYGQRPNFLNSYGWQLNLAAKGAGRINLDVFISDSFRRAGMTELLAKPDLYGGFRAPETP